MMPKESITTVPGMACVRYVPLLSLTTHALLDDARLAEEVRAHVADCAHCRQEMALQERLDAALRRVADDRIKDAALFSREEIVRMRERVEGVAASGSRSIAKNRLARRAKGGVFIGIPAIAAVLLLALFAGFVFHLAPGHSGIGVGPSKHTTLPSNIDLYSISMDSATDGWAVGGTRPDPNYSPVQDGTPRSNYRDPVLAHYHEGVWSIVSLPTALQRLVKNGLSIVLYGVSMVSEDEGWAAGGSVLPPNADGMTIGVLLHYTHGTWMLAAGGTSETPVFSVVRMRSATDGWAVAGSTVYHYDGITWRQMKDPALKNISVETWALAPDGSIWAEGVDYGFTGGSGFDGDAPSTFLHFDRSRWARVASPLPHARITSMAMASASEGWAVGALPPMNGATQPNNAVILHYHDGRWEEQVRYQGPIDATGISYSTFLRVLVTADGECWAVGSNGLLARYIHGTWERLPDAGRATLYDVVFASPADGWAVGEHGTVLHFANGSWSVYGE